MNRELFMESFEEQLQQLEEVVKLFREKAEQLPEPDSFVAGRVELYEEMIQKQRTLFIEIQQAMKEEDYSTVDRGITLIAELVNMLRDDAVESQNYLRCRRSNGN
jgi:hypothetical protein